MDIATAITTLGALKEITAAIINGKIDDAVKAEAANLNNSILSLQGVIFSLQRDNHQFLDSKRELEEKVINQTNWHKKECRYFLNEICAGVFLYTLKPDHQNSEPLHHICPNCYSNKTHSILSRKEPNMDGTIYVCSNKNCNAEYNDYCNKHNMATISLSSPSVF